MVRKLKNIWQSVKYETRRLLAVQWLTIATVLRLWWNKSRTQFVVYSEVGRETLWSQIQQSRKKWCKKSGVKDTMSYLDCSQKLSSKPPLITSLQNRPEWKLYYTSRPLNYLLSLNIQAQSPLKLLCVSPFGTDFADAVSKLWLTSHNAKVFVPGILTHTRYRMWNANTGESC